MSGSGRAGAGKQENSLEHLGANVTKSSGYWGLVKSHRPHANVNTLNRTELPLKIVKMVNGRLWGFDRN